MARYRNKQRTIYKVRDTIESFQCVTDNEIWRVHGDDLDHFVVNKEEYRLRKKSSKTGLNRSTRPRVGRCS